MGKLDDVRTRLRLASGLTGAVSGRAGDTVAAADSLIQDFENAVREAAIKAAAEVCERRATELPICSESINKEAGLMMGKRAILALLDTEGGGE